MAGICGIITSKKNPFTRNLLEKMVQSLVMDKNQHVITLFFDNAAIGVVGRINQSPDEIYSTYHKYIIFVQGHFYFSKEQLDWLDKTRIESDSYKPNALLRLYIHAGKNTIKSLRGDFNILILRQDQFEFILFNSHLGIIPMYFHKDRDQLIFSSNINAFPRIDFNRPNYSGILEQILFNYQISNDSILKEIYLLPAGNFVESKNGEMIFSRYADFHDLFKKPGLGKNESVHFLNEKLSDAINLLPTNGKQYGLSFTAGFDSRLLLSYLLSNTKPYTYSFGTESAKDITVPHHISEIVKLDYHPFILNKTYLEKSFLKNARNIISISGASVTYRRTHYYYTLSQLPFLDFVFSGNGGSNLLKSVNKAGMVFNSNVLKLFSSKHPEDTLSEIFLEFSSAGIWNSEFFDKEEFINNVMGSEIIWDNNMPTNQRFYLFLLSNIERKYFGKEMQSYYHVVLNYSPFFDIEFLRALAMTPFFGGHSEFMPKGMAHKGMQSLLYAKLIKLNYPDLLYFESDKGFYPSDVLNFRGNIKILHNRFIEKKVRKHRFNNYNEKLYDHIFANQLSGKEFSSILPMENVIQSNLTAIPKSNLLSILYWFSTLQ